MESIASIFCTERCSNGFNLFVLRVCAILQDTHGFLASFRKRVANASCRSAGASSLAPSVEKDWLPKRLDDERASPLLSPLAASVVDAQSPSDAYDKLVGEGRISSDSKQRDALERLDELWRALPDHRERVLAHAKSAR